MSQLDCESSWGQDWYLPCRVFPCPLPSHPQPLASHALTVNVACADCQGHQGCLAWVGPGWAGWVWFPILLLPVPGRVARAGRSGTAYSLVAPDEMPYVFDLHLFLGRPLVLAGAQEMPAGEGWLCGHWGVILGQCWSL